MAELVIYVCTVGCGTMSYMNREQFLHRISHRPLSQTRLFSGFPQASFSLKGFATPWTCKGPLPCVNHHVFSQLTGFAANLTHKWPQPDMFGSMVSHQMTVFCTELFPTIGTSAKQLLYVLSPVQNQMSEKLEAWPARFTNTWCYTRSMQFFMILQS